MAMSQALNIEPVTVIPQESNENSQEGTSVESAEESGTEKATKETKPKVDAESEE